MWEVYGTNAARRVVQLLWDSVEEHSLVRRALKCFALMYSSPVLGALSPPRRCPPGVSKLLYLLTYPRCPPGVPRVSQGDGCTCRHASKAAVTASVARICSTSRYMSAGSAPLSCVAARAAQPASVVQVLERPSCLSFVSRPAVGGGARRAARPSSPSGLLLRSSLPSAGSVPARLARGPPARHRRCRCWTAQGT